MSTSRKKRAGAWAFAVLFVLTFLASGLTAQAKGADAGVEEEPAKAASVQRDSEDEAAPVEKEWKKGGPDHYRPGRGSPFVDILVPLGFFSMIALIVVVPLILRKRRRAIDAEVQKAAIEKGMQYIPELPAPAKAPRNDRRTGMLVAGVGLAVLVPLLLAGHTSWALVGLGPILLGAVYFLSGVLLGKDKEDR